MDSRSLQAQCRRRQQVLDRLIQHNPGRLGLFTRNISWPRCPEMVRALLDAAGQIRREQPENCLILSQLAVEIAADTNAGDRILALAHIANSLRVTGDARGAAATWSEVDSVDHQGDLDPESEAEVLSLRATWLRDLSRHDEAADCLMRAGDLYTSAGHSLTCIRIQLAALAFDGGDLEAAFVTIKDVLEELDAGTPEPATVSMVLQNAAVIAQEGMTRATGESRRRWEGIALAVTEAARVSVDLHGSGIEARKLDWTIGRLLVEMGDDDLGRQILECSCRGLVDLGQPALAAAVGLEIVLLHMGRRDINSVMEWAEFCFRAFAASGLPAEFAATLRLLVTTRDSQQAQALLVSLTRSGRRPGSGNPQATT